MDKQKLRQKFKAIRAGLSGEHRAFAEQIITKEFLKLISEMPVKNIAGYQPINHEINITPLLHQLELLGYVICLPKVKQENILEFYCEQQLVIPDLIIAPLLACDMRGVRLGYGMGCYDITIANMETKSIIVGLAYHAQLTDNLPQDAHDQKLDHIITEQLRLKIS